MKTHAREWAALDKSTCFLFCSGDNDVAQQLGHAIGDLGLLMQELPEPEQLARRLADIDPQVVFLDFTGGQADPGKLLLAADLARVLARVAPAVPRVAVGYLAQPDGAIAALRAGVSDFVDPSVSPDEVHGVVQRLVSNRRIGGGSGGEHRSVLILGARPGVGASTLAVHMAGLTQERMAQAALARQGAVAGKPARSAEVMAAQLPLSDRVGVLDLGWPIGDCLLYLNISSDFDFAEAARNLSRLDGTLLNSAMAHTASGVSALALPREVEQVRALSPNDSLLLFERLRQHYGTLVTDAGGLANRVRRQAGARLARNLAGYRPERQRPGLAGRRRAGARAVPRREVGPAAGGQPLRRTLWHERGADRRTLRAGTGRHAARPHAAADGLHQPGALAARAGRTGYLRAGRADAGRPAAGRQRGAARAAQQLAGQLAAWRASLNQCR